MDGVYTKEVHKGNIGFLRKENEVQYDCLREVHKSRHKGNI